MRLAVMILAACVFVLTFECLAQETKPAQVTVGGELVLRIRFSAGGMSPKERADAIAQRLITILADPDIQPSDIVVKPIANGEAAIYVKEHLLVTVDNHHARANRTTPQRLGEMWAEKIRKVLPLIKVQEQPT